MSEQRTAKVESVLKVRSWNGPNGTVWYHELLMDNGDKGEIGKKKENAFNPGDSLTYTIESSEYGNKFKEVREGFGGFSGAKSQGGARGSSASFALSYAKDIAVANIASAGAQEMEPLGNKIVAMATKFHQWLQERE